MFHKDKIEEYRKKLISELVSKYKKDFNSDFVYTKKIIGAMSYYHENRNSENLDHDDVLIEALYKMPSVSGASKKDIKHIKNKGNFDFDNKVWNNFSENAKDLLKKMLAVNPDERPSAAELLSHPWFISMLLKVKEKNSQVKVNYEIKKHCDWDNEEKIKISIL